MAKRNRYRDHVDPDYRRWGSTYSHFPGVAECARLIRIGKTRGAWADIITYELAENAAVCLPELIETFHTDPSFQLYVMMALDIARTPESVPFLAEILNEGDPRFIPFAVRALKAIDTSASRAALWKSAHPQINDSPNHDIM